MILAHRAKIPFYPPKLCIDKSSHEGTGLFLAGGNACHHLVCVTRRKQHRPGIAPNANATHVPAAGSSAAPTKPNLVCDVENAKKKEIAQQQRPGITKNDKNNGTNNTTNKLKWPILIYVYIYIYNKSTMLLQSSQQTT